MTDIIQDADNTPTIAQITTDTPVTDKTAPAVENSTTTTADATANTDATTIKNAAQDTKTTKSTKTTARKGTANTNTTVSDAASTSANGDVTTANSDNATTTTTDVVKVKAPMTNTVANDVISVTNGWHDDLFETATGTLLPAGKTTEIKVTHKANRERILRNLEQINLIHGNKLTIN